MKPVALTVIALVLIAAKPEGGFESIWRTDGPALEAQGITQPMARQAFLWTELQYHLGICGSFMAENDLAFWRLWWRDTPLERAEMGRQILAAGDTNYYKGVEDRRKRPLSARQCRRVLASWVGDMRRAIATN